MWCLGERKLQIKGCGLSMALKSKIHEVDFIDIWEIDINRQNIEVAKQYRSVLSKLELDNINKFRFFKDYSVYLVPHVAVRLLISDYINITAEKIPYQYGKNGKPWIFGNIHFNLSHTHKKALML